MSGRFTLMSAAEARRMRAERAAERAARAVERARMHRTVDEVLAEAGLPEPLEAVVRETARELAAHFRSGLEAGAMPHDLRARFGEPKVVAPLLRTSARRKRPGPDRLVGRSLRWGGAALGIAVLGYAVAAVRLATMQPTITMDGFARLQALVPAVPADGGAWPAYREGLGWHRALRGGGHPDEATRVRLGQAIRTDDASPEDFAASAAALRAHADDLARLRRAAAMPVLGIRLAAELPPEDQAWFGDLPRPWGDAVPETMIINARLPYIRELREAGGILADDARLAAIHEADGKRAADDLVAILGVARHVGEIPVVISQLTESALVSLAASETIHVLERAPEVFAATDLARLAAAFAGIDPATWRLDVAGEELWLRDLVQHLYSDDGDGDGVLLPGPARAFVAATTSRVEGGGWDDEPLDAQELVAAPFVAAVAAGRRETLELVERMYGLLEQDAGVPLARRSHPLDREVEQLKHRGRRRHPIVNLMMPALGRASETRFVARGMADAARVAIALEQWRREHGAWPDALARLVPARLPAIPRDVHDGEPVRYRLESGGPLLWMVGHDGRDDGGAAAMDPRTGRTTRQPSRHHEGPADVILFDVRGGGEADGPAG